MKKLTLSIIASLTLTGCFTTQTYQPQPQVIYYQQAPEPRVMPTRRLANETFKNVDYGTYKQQEQLQQYDVIDVNTGQTKTYNVQKY